MVKIGDRAPDGDHEGPAAVPEALFAELHRDLRRLAAAHMGGQARGHTLQTTALVNEAFLKLGNRHGWPSKAHFMSAAARAMRSILVDHARAKKRQKRSAAGVRVPLDGVLEAYQGDTVDLVALDEALEVLGCRGARGRQAARVVELRFFCGLSMDEVAEVAGISVREAGRAWALARASLRAELS